MKNWLVALALVVCLCLIAFRRPSGHAAAANVSAANLGSTNMGEDDFRKLEQAWLDAASVPDLPALRKMFSDDFMGTSFGGRVLSKSDVVPPASGAHANHWRNLC